MLYQYTIFPIECIYKIIYLFFSEILDHYGLALIALSLLTSLIIHPLMKWAAKLQNEEKRLQDVMKPQIEAIKAVSSGAEQYQRIQRMYQRYGYHPVMAIRSAIGVMLQIPFLMAAFYMLSKLPEIQGVPWGFVKDLGGPDALLSVGKWKINVFPFVMTAVNLLSAYTTKGFSKRDRLQAIVIAVLFLVLLYKAPSALLIYWTCNNLWTLLGNIKDIIFAKHGITDHSFTVRGKKPGDWILGAPAALYVCFALAATVCVLVPSDVYLVNAKELWFGLTDMLKYLAPSALAVFAVLAVIYFILPNQTLKAWFTALVLGLLLGFWLQSYVINLDYGILDGRTIQWDSYKMEAVLNTVAWIACIVLPFIALRYWKAEKFCRLAKRVAVVLLVVQVFSAFYVAGATGGKQNKTADNVILTTEEEFTVSSKDNIIVFLLDAFESKTFREIQQKNPEIIEKLNGFTYYPDATSYFGLTDYSLPQILTGKPFTNQGTYANYLKHSWKGNPFYKLLRNKNYDIRLYTFDTFMRGAEGFVDNLQKAKYIVNSEVFNYFKDLCLFREMPHLLKKYYVIYSVVLRNPVVEDKKAEPYRENDVAFYNKMKNGLQLRDDKNCFKFYHMNGAHKPYTMTADIKRVKLGSGVTQYEQSVGALKIVLEYIEMLQKNKLYNNTTFAILADHGKHSSTATAPLVLIKQPNAPDRPLEVRKNPISFNGLHATLLKRFGSESAGFGKDFSTLTENNRTYYLVALKNQDIVMDEYRIHGDVEKKESWKVIRTIKNYIKSSSDRSYALGTKIDFSTNGTSIKYMGDGWRRPMLHDSGIRGNKADLNFKLQNFKGKDLNLTMWARPALRDGAASRNLSVYVEGKKLCTWKMKKKGQYKVKIPKNLVKKNNLKIVFKVENPIDHKIEDFARASHVLVTFMQIN